MDDFRPEDFDQAFSQLDPIQPRGVNASEEELIQLEFEIKDETVRKSGIGVFQLKVVAFVVR